MQQICPEYEDSCEAIVHQTVEASVPISLVPSINLGSIKIVCDAQPRVECCSKGCGGSGLELTITQTVTYKIPLEYRATATAGDVITECKKNIANSSCSHCHF